MNQAGAPVGEIPFSRTGLLGFVGPVRKTLIGLFTRKYLDGFYNVAVEASFLFLFFNFFVAF